MSMYIRIKREKLTVFMHVEPTDTVTMLKDKLQELLQQPAEDQQLYKAGTLLEDDKTLAELGVSTDDELAVAYRMEDDSFEGVSVEQFDGSGSRADAG